MTRPGLEPRPLNPEFSALSIRPLRPGPMQLPPPPFRFCNFKWSYPRPHHWHSVSYSPPSYSVGDDWSPLISPWKQWDPPPKKSSTSFPPLPHQKGINNARCLACWYFYRFFCFSYIYVSYWVWGQKPFWELNSFLFITMVYHRSVFSRFSHFRYRSQIFRRQSFSGLSGNWEGKWTR